MSGRYYAMDRDARWERIAKAYNAIMDAQGNRFPDAQAAIADAYSQRLFDEFIVPAVIGNYRGIKRRRRRAVLQLPLRPGARNPRRHPRSAGRLGLRAAQQHADRRRGRHDVSTATSSTRVMQSIFPPQTFPNILGEIVAAAGRTQLRMAETEKYPHVTYFLNGGREEPYDGEARIMVPSPKVATYDMKPEMSAPELTDKAVMAINSGQFDLIVLNYANPDMVGHTGSLPAAIKAVETVDAGLGRIAEAVEKAGGALLVTADHGNCELMRDPETGGPHTAHTTNPVPVCCWAAATRSLADGRLADIAPTLLELMELPKPAEMTGASLLRKQASARLTYRRGRARPPSNRARASGRAPTAPP